MEKHVIGADALRRALASLPAKQIPFAASLAINLTAKDMKRATDARLVQAFASPKAFTRNAAFVRLGNKRRPNAIVGIKDKQAKYLEVQEAGGVRRHKAFERALRSSGVLRHGEYAMPTGVLRPTRSLYVTMLAKVRGSQSRGRQRKIAGAVFVPQSDSNLPRGIWRRMRNGKLQPVFIFTRRKPTYRPRLRFMATALAVFSRVMPGHAKTAAKRAIRTAK